jgi:hypothetical protein
MFVAYLYRMAGVVCRITRSRCEYINGTVIASVSGQRDSDANGDKEARFVKKLRICKKWNVTVSKPLRDPGEGPRQ